MRNFQIKILSAKIHILNSPNKNLVGFKKEFFKLSDEIKNF